MILKLFIIAVFVLIISAIVVSLHSQVQQNKLDFIDEVSNRGLDPSDFFNYR